MQLDARLRQPAVVDAFEEAVEEPPLQGKALWEAEPFLVAPAVDLQPLVVRGGTGKAGEVAPGVQAKAGPVGRRQQRDRDLGQVRGAGPVELVIEVMIADTRHQVSPLGLKYMIGEGVRPGGQPAAAAVGQPPLALGSASSHTMCSPEEPSSTSGCWASRRSHSARWLSRKWTPLP